MRHRFFATLLLGWILGWIAPSGALAQPTGPELVERGLAAYEAGDFEQARELLAQARRSPGLTRDQVVQALRHEVLVAQALHDETLDTALLRLVSLEPDGMSGYASPQLTPALTRALQQTHGEVVRLEIEHEPVAEHTRVRARVRGDLGALVQEVRLWVRAEGTPFGDPVPGAAEVEATVERVEVAAQAIGPGGAVLAHLGTEDAPVRLVREAPDASLIVDPPRPVDDTGLHLAIAIGVVAAFVVAGAIAIGVVVTEQGNALVPIEGPRVEW